MASGAVICNNGANAILLRGYNTTYTAFSRFKIGTGTNTPAITDTDLQTVISAWYSGSDYGPYTSGYDPLPDTTNKKVTVRGFVSSLQANGNTISECAEFNTDATPVMLGRDVFATPVVKDNTIEVFIVLVHQLVNT